MVIHPFKILLLGLVCAAGLPALVRCDDPPVMTEGQDPAESESAKQRAIQLRTGQTVDLADVSEERMKTLLSSMRESPRMKKLLQERVETAQQETDTRWHEFLAGRGTLDILLGASKRLLQAEWEIARNRADRIAVVEAYWQRCEDVESINQARFAAARIGIQDLAESRHDRLQAEILLERLKTGKAIETNPQLTDRR